MNTLLVFYLKSGIACHQALYLSGGVTFCGNYRPYILKYNTLFQRVGAFFIANRLIVGVDSIDHQPKHHRLA